MSIVRPRRPWPATVDLEAAAECALAFARPLATGWITFGEVESRVLPFLTGPDWRGVKQGRELTSAFIDAAVTTWRATR